MASAGVLADEAGLGKKVQAAALVALLAEARGCPGPHLVLAPRALLSGWVGPLQTSIICGIYLIEIYYIHRICC